MDKTLKQLEADYAAVLKNLGIMKTKGIAQHVREYVAANPTVSKSKARPIVVLKYKTLESDKVALYVKLAAHKDTLVTEQVFTKSACLRFRSKSVTERQAGLTSKAKAKAEFKQAIKDTAKAIKAKAKKPVKRKTLKKS